MIHNSTAKMSTGEIFKNLHDYPIELASEDLLDRGPFSRIVANALLAPNPKGATVIGLVGAWGSGKSSLANLVLSEVGNRAEIIRFEPWMITNCEALAVEFFTMLGRQIFNSSELRSDTDARKRFYTYASKALGIISIGAAGIGALVPVVGVGGNAAKSMGDAFLLAAEGLEAQSQQVPLSEAKQKIKADLSEIDKPIIITIDDLDRLDKDEIRTVFQLVKACADFPNIRYLVMYDREQVLHALDQVVVNPDAFLEKIVGQAIDIPEPTTMQRSAILDKALESLGLHTNLSKDASERLGMLFEEVLLPGLSSIRKVKRFVNTIGMILPSVIVDGFRNIDPADFLALEYIRQHAFPLYGVLRAEVAPNAGGRIARMINHEKAMDDKIDKRVKAISLLNEPQLSLAKEALDSFSLRNNSDSFATAEKRFETDYWKPVYLAFSDARATISEALWASFLLTLRSDNDVTEFLKSWSDRLLRDKWVTALTSRASELTTQQKIRLLTHLFRWGEAMPYEQSQFSSNPHYSWDEAVRFIATAILETESSGKTQQEIVKKSVEDSNALIGPGLVIGMEVSRIAKGGFGHWARGIDFNYLLKVLEPKLTEIIETGEVWSRPDPSEVIHAWAYAIGNDAYMSWRSELISKPKEFANYINFCMGNRMSDKPLLDWTIDDDWLDAIERIDINLLTPDGAKARLHCLNSAARIKRRVDVPSWGDE